MAADVDGDTLVDVLLGSYSGAVYYWRNTGSPKSPRFMAVTDPALNPFHGTTTAAYYATVHVPATTLLAQLCLAAGQRARLRASAAAPPSSPACVAPDAGSGQPAARTEM